LQPIINDKDKKITCNSFKTQKSNGEKWKTEDTEKFYMALQIWGTDYQMIEMAFQGQRNRYQIKKKHQREEKINEKLISELLTKPCPSVEEFQKKYGELKELKEAGLIIVSPKPLLVKADLAKLAGDLQVCLLLWSSPGASVLYPGHQMKQSSCGLSVARRYNDGH